MLDAVFLALAAAFVIAWRDPLGRLVVDSIDPVVGSALTAVLGLPILAALSLLQGDAAGPWPSWSASVLVIGVAGVLRIALARALLFAAIERIGSARASSLSSTSVLFALLLGPVALEERLSARLVAGAVLIVFGSITIARSRTTLTRDMEAGAYARGIFLSVTAAALFAGSAVLARAVIDDFASPVQANLYANAVAVVVCGPTLLRRSTRERLTRLPRRVWGLTLSIAGIMAIGTSLTYLALAAGPVVLVQPITQSRPLFVLVIAGLLFRERERLNARVVRGGLAIVAGAALLMIA
ncbi:MAG: EamA family transporter [Myxococcota bacterium]